eukprot:7452658-Alexandrium_andersonii.AAC.1
MRDNSLTPEAPSEGCEAWRQRRGRRSIFPFQSLNAQSPRCQASLAAYAGLWVGVPQAQERAREHELLAGS